MYVANLRYIQSVHEPADSRNPDILVRRFLPMLQRWKVSLLSKRALAELRADPFYYFLVARTRHYDQVIVDAVNDGVRRIVGIGCGTDTRAHRFGSLLRDKGVKVLECDQAEAIQVKERLAQRLEPGAPIEYLPIDLNDSEWPALQRWLGDSGPKTLVMLEGVSPYVNDTQFAGFLTFLTRSLPKGSHVAYDYKIRGVIDDFGRGGRTERPFRLSKLQSEVAAFHQQHGLTLDSFELASDLTVRLLPSVPASPLFIQDALLRLHV